METVRTAVDLFRDRVSVSGDRPALRVKEGGEWRTRSWNDWNQAAREIAGGLRALGVARGDRVCILSNTRPEWVETDVGILFAGAVTVPIYQSNTPRECEYIINDCKAKVVFIEDAAQWKKLTHPEVRPTLKDVLRVVTFTDVEGDDDWATPLAGLRKSGREWLEKNELEDELGPDDTFTIVYTSGTTGPPKGVVLTHANIVFECGALRECLDIGEDDEQLLFLPLAHIFAKLLEWTAVDRGFVTAFAEGLPQLIDNMKEVKPTVMGAVPRVYEKAYNKIRAGLDEKRKSAVGRFIIDRALAAGKRRSAAEQAGRTPGALEGLEVGVADKLVFGKIKDTFGGRLRFFISGGAPLTREIAEFFHAAGVLILEGYGLTETTAATHINRPDRFRFGTVGPALPGVEIKVAEDGEVLMRGKNILREYYGKPDATREAIDADGWFHSGDIGVLEDGFLRITDRKKDIIVTAGGKNVAPQNIEGALKALSPYVSQVMVHGDRRPYLVALVTMNPELAEKPDAEDQIKEAVGRLNANLASYETIKKFKILPKDFTQEAGELTPTLKVKRKFVSEKYKPLLDSFYAAENP